MLNLASIAEFTYTVVLKPRPLRWMTNAVIPFCLPKQLAIDGVQVVLNPNDPVVSGALTFGVYEKPESHFFRAVCQPGMNVLDIGANVGYYTALAIKASQGQGRIVALEPDPENFRLLEATVAANRASNVTCINGAAADHPGEMTLFTSSENRGDNRLYESKLSNGSVRVKTYTIDGLMDQLGMPSLDFVKIDVQGFEGRVFDGMRETLKRSPALTVLTEFWPFGLRSAGSDAAVMLSNLEEAGFTLYHLTAAGTVEPLANKEKLIRDYPGRRYTNLVASKVPGLERITRRDGRGAR